MDSTIDTDVGPDRAASSKGRPRQFDDEAVLDTLVHLFWAQGYEATSLTDIVAATGLSKSSLYNSFGSKEELFGQALNRYIDFRIALVSGVLLSGSRGLQDISLLLDSLWAEVNDGGDHRGCLAVNTSVELGMRDDQVVAAGQHYRSSLRSALEAALTRAGHLGEIDPSLIGHYSNVMVSFMLGTAVIVRSGASDAEILGQIDAARAILEGWRSV